MSHGIRHALLGTASAVSILILASPAAAQAPARATPAQASEPAMLGEVVVTARRREENVQEIPVAVSAFSNEALEEKQILGPQDLSKLSPGLQLSASQGVRDNFIPYIRGQGSSFGTNQASVIPYFAEAPNFNVSYYDLANLQIIKGPQGTLFGETATGGVLLYTPRKPSQDFNGYARAAIGNYDYRLFEGAIGGPIIKDKLAVRIAGQIRQREGFTTAYSSVGQPPSLFDDIDRTEWRASVVFTPFENLELYGIFAYNHIKSNGQAQLAYLAPNKLTALNFFGPGSSPITAATFEYFAGRPPPAGASWQQLIEDAVVRQRALGPRATNVNYDHHRETKFYGFIGQATWDITENLTLKNIYSVSWTKAKGATLETDANDLPLVDTRYQENIPGISPSDGFLETAKNWTNETQLLGTLFDNKLDWQTGFYYRRNPPDFWTGPQGMIIVFASPQGLPSPAATCAGLGITTQPCGTLTRTLSESYAGYAQATYHVTPEISVTGGYRRTWDYRRTETTAGPVFFRNFRGVNIPLSVAGTQPIPGAGITRTEVPRNSAGTYTLAADWKFAPDWLAYITHRTGYKGGGINGNTPETDPNRFFGPERVKDVEFGLKGDFEIAGWQMRTNLAAYKTWYDDIQRTTLLPGTAQTVTQNLAAAIIQGIELEVNVRPSQYFEVAGFYAYTDAKFEEWLESTRCASQPYQPVCFGLPGTTPLTVDHAGGSASAGGRTQTFSPDILAEVSKHRYGIQPTVNLGFLGENLANASLSANIYYRSSSTSADQNNSAQVGGANILPGYTLVDARFDWRNVRDSNLSLFASVTNLEDKTFPIFIGDASNICNCIHAIYSEPRMWTVGLTMEFGG